MNDSLLIQQLAAGAEACFEAIRRHDETNDDSKLGAYDEYQIITRAVLVALLADCEARH